MYRINIENWLASKVSIGKATFCLIAGGSDYIKMGLPRAFLFFSAKTTSPWRFDLAPDNVRY
jgi:hypothetical protein